MYKHDKEKCCLNCRIHWDREGCCEVCRWEDNDNPSLFYRITRSPEVLAPKFVYHIDYGEAGGGYVSTIVKGLWHNESEAIAATLEELNKG